MTIQQIIDTVLAATPYDAKRETVDTVKTGDPSQPARGIVTTFLASHAVLKSAVAAGANFIITHEPTFYNHRDETSWLATDAVYLAKRKYIDDHGLVIWRFHDYWHRHQPDGITTGVSRALGWEQYLDRNAPPFCTLPGMKLSDVAAHVKKKLGADSLRVIGNPEMICRRTGLLLGASGGRSHIEALGKPGVDLVICGEINEWETNEYVRDANSLGLGKALIVAGHAASEEAGMSYLAEWLGERISGVPITHVPTGDALRWV